MIIETDHYADGPPPAASRKLPNQPRLAEVRRDMAAIFGENAIAGRARPLRAMPLRKAEPALQPQARRGLKPAPLLAAALAGLILGIAAIGTPRLIGHAAPDKPATAPATTVAASPFEDATPPDAAAPSAVPAPLSPAASKPVERPEPVRLAKTEMPKKPAKPAREGMAAAEPASRGAQCEGDRLERHWCLRHDILKADRTLRLAYANAIREGVERRFLVAHQRRWTQLRDRASSDPDGVVAGYRELAEDLDRLSVNGRRRDRIS